MHDATPIQEKMGVADTIMQKLAEFFGLEVIFEFYYSSVAAIHHKKIVRTFSLKNLCGFGCKTWEKKKPHILNFPRFDWL